MNTSVAVVVAALAAALAISGCSAGASPRQDVVLSTRDPPFWVQPDDIERYVCADGVFVCEGAIGRTSDRLCRCIAR